MLAKKNFIDVSLNKLRGVRVDEYAYYVKKLRQNVSLETWIWRHIVTSHTAYTKYRWPPYATEWKHPPWEISAYATAVIYSNLKKHKVFSTAKAWKHYRCREWCHMIFALDSLYAACESWLFFEKKNLSDLKKSWYDEIKPGYLHQLPKIWKTHTPIKTK